MNILRVLALLLLAPLTANAAVGPLVNAASLTVVSGGTWQQMFPANQNRSTLWIENPCSSTTQGVTAESLFVAFGTKPSSTAGTFELTSCGSLVMSGTYISQQAVWVYAATTAHKFEAAQTQ